VGGGEGSARGKPEVRVAASRVNGLPNDTRVWPRAKIDAVLRPREKGRIPDGLFVPKGALTVQDNNLRASCLLREGVL
jgi:hypothetical protein